MYPSIRSLDVCVFREIEPHRIRTGDILVYDEDGIAVVHRVLGVDRGKGCVLMKGDNIPFRHAEKIPFTVIRGKVRSVKRGNKVIDLEKFPRKFTGALLAFLSRHDLTPSLFKSRFIDPPLLSFSGSPVYVSFRKIFYKNISYAHFRAGKCCRLYAMVGKAKSADAFMKPEEGGKVLLNSYIRRRDRNRVFAEKFVRKIMEVADKEYNGWSEIHVKDKVLKDLVNPVGGFDLTGSVLNKDLTMQQINRYPALDFDPSALRREEELVILCSRLEMSEDMRGRFASLMAEGAVDWRRFLDLAELHMVKPLIYRHMQIFSEYFPEEVKKKLRDEGARVFVQNAKVLEEIRSLAELFAESSLEILFTKGASFILDIYRDKPGLRPLSDIDILVREEDFAGVDSVLRKNGFRLCEENKGFERYRTQVLYSFEGKVFLDVHRGFIGRKLHDDMLGIEEETIWKNKRKLSMRGADIYTLDLTHTLLYQCLHLAMQHSFSGIRWYVDILEFLNRYGDELDWDEITRLARNYKIQRPVYSSLLFARGMLSAPVPENVLDDMGKIERKLDRLVFRKIKKNNAETDYLAELFMFDRMADTAKFVFLCLLKHPYLIRHFFIVSSKATKQIFTRKRSLAISS